MKNPINWKLFWFLLVASLLSVIAVFPYVLTLRADLFKELPISLPALLSIQLLQSAVLFAIFIFTGLYLGEKVGLGAPILERWLEGKEAKSYLKSILSISIALGMLAGVLVIGLDILFSIFAGTITLAQFTPPPIWQGFLASFYGGIGEEVAVRLFIMTLLVWISFKIKSREGKPTNLGVWAAIIITAIVFGIGHLPITSALTEITPLVVARAVILNGTAGIIFGWLYWKKGLESAMISHFSADMLLHVVLPLFI